MQTRHLGVLLGVALAVTTGFVACSAAPMEADDLTAIDEANQAIERGTELSSNPAYVAIYHRMNDTDGNRGFHWAGRPCSGAVLRHVDNKSYVLTARHCLTDDGKPFGTVVGTGDVKVTMALRPGPVTCSGASCSLPSGTLAVSHIATIPISALCAEGGNYKSGCDLAILTVDGDLPATSKLAIDMSPIASHAGMSAEIAGYGRNINLTDTTDEPELTGVNTGAGVLRQASGFKLLSADGTFKTYEAGSYLYPDVATSPNGARSNQGDSGAPTMRQMTFMGLVWRTIIGVRSAGDRETALDASVSAAREWIINNAGRHAYISPIKDKSKNLGLTSGSPSHNATIGLVSGDTPSTGWYFQESQKRIHLTPTFYASSGSVYVNFCLDGSDTSTLKMADCSSSASQQWEILKGQKLRNLGTGLCVSYSTGALGQADCSSLSTTGAWFWHLQP